MLRSNLPKERRAPVKDVFEGVGLGRVVIKHQEHAREGQHDEKVKSNPAHAPGERVAHCIAIDLSRMQVQENVGKNC